MWKSPAGMGNFCQSTLVNSFEAISERARDLISSGNWDVDYAVNKAVDEAFEEGLISGELDYQSQVKRQLLSFGKLDSLIFDEEVEEIWINSPDQVFVARNSISQKCDLKLTSLEVRQFVERMLRDSGRRLDKASPFVDATLRDGSRLHVVIPEVTKEHWAVNIRKFPSQIYTLEDLIAFGSLSRESANYLTQKFNSGNNILISGATQSGKTTMLSALLNVGRNHDRLISVEETFEIRTNYLDHVAMQARQANLEGLGEITLRRLIKEALRMRPTRLVIGEVRQAEALDLLIALNSGISGLCTIHANSALEAIEKLKLLPLLAGENIPAAFIEATVHGTVDVVVHCAINNGRRTIAQILEIDRKGQSASWLEIKC